MQRPHLHVPIARPLQRRLLTTVLLLLTCHIAFAQHRYDEWHFGYHQSIRFTKGGPVALTGSGMLTQQGAASICDAATGELLFYTNGVSVWNREHQVMPNGGSLFGQISSVQAALIVPMPGDADRYYIFTNDETESPKAPNGYHYSIVDMRLDGGRGNVTAKNIELVSNVSEHQTAVRHCNGRDFWVITHSSVGSRFFAFLVTPTGIASEPVISTLGKSTTGFGSSLGTSMQGALKASPDGRMLAASFGDGSFELYRFDPLTGRLSESLLLKEVPDEAYWHIGVSFSPDGTRLYVSGVGGIDQFSLESGDPATIAASGFKVSNRPSADIQLGPDGRLYGIPYYRPGWISVISFPNLAGFECEFDESYLFSGGNGTWQFGLPNNIDALDAGGVAINASIPRTLKTNPGKPIDAPILLDPSSGTIPARTMTLRLRYDSTMLRLVTDDPFLGTTTKGALLDGWEMSDVTDRPGVFTATFTPPPGVTSLTAPGILIHLRFKTFISIRKGDTPTLISELPFEIVTDGTSACGGGTSPGMARLELCGLSLRMIESTAAKYALDGIMPNPFRGSAEIRFSIGLDGPTRVEVFDAEGSSAAILADREMTAGDYLLTWDANRFPSGLYYCRITSGAWTRTVPMVVDR